MFTYDQALTPVLTSFSVAASTDGESLEITFIGTGFGTSAYVYLDGIEQQILSATDEVVVAKVINFNALSAETVEFYAATGTPLGFFSVL